jgi:hypothetical protein
MSFENRPENQVSDEASQVGYGLFLRAAVRRFNPGLYAIRAENDKGWHLIELRDGKWVCDCNSETPSASESHCPHVYAVLLHSATHRGDLDESCDTADEKSLRCRYCGSPDISKVGFRYNSRGISRRYLCNECRRKFSVAYVEPETALGAPSGTLWLLSQVAMLTSKLNELLRDLDLKVSASRNTPSHDAADSSIRS